MYAGEKSYSVSWKAIKLLVIPKTLSFIMRAFGNRLFISLSLSNRIEENSDSNCTRVSLVRRPIGVRYRTQKSFLQNPGIQCANGINRWGSIGNQKFGVWQ